MKNSADFGWPADGGNNERGWILRISGGTRPSIWRRRSSKWFDRLVKNAKLRRSYYCLKACVERRLKGVWVVGNQSCHQGLAELPRYNCHRPSFLLPDLNSVPSASLSPN